MTLDQLRDLRDSFDRQMAMEQTKLNGKKEGIEEFYSAMFNILHEERNKIKNPKEE